LRVCREDLARPAQTLFLHNLTGILETAIRATNAQYDDADILRRLDVRLLEVVFYFYLTKLKAAFICIVNFEVYMTYSLAPCKV